MRQVSHLSPGYVYRRIRQMIHQRRHPDHPWITADAVRILEDLIRPTDRGLEIGAGRSTPWLGKRCAQLVSVEWHPEWHAKVQEMLKKQQVSTVDLRFLPVGFRVETEHDEERWRESNYFRFFAGLDDSSLDFALIDGPVRAGCSLLLIPKLKPGGIYILDNASDYLPHPTSSPRSEFHSDPNIEPLPSWKEFLQQTLDWRRIWTSDGVSDTAILFKPVHSQAPTAQT